MLDKRQTIIISMGFICLLVSLAPATRAWEDWRLSERGKSTPNQMRVRDLADQGPGENIHVKLVEFQFGKDYVVQRINGQWASVYLPIYPRGTLTDSKQRPPTPKVVIKTGGLNSQKDVESFENCNMLTGVVTNSIDGGNFDLSEFKKKYPDLKPSAVWVVDVGRSFPTQGTFQMHLGIAGALALIAVVSVVVCLVLPSTNDPLKGGSGPGAEQVIAKRN